MVGLLPYKDELIKGLEETQTRSRDLRESRKEVADLLRKYNEFVRTPLFCLDDLTGRRRQYPTSSSNYITVSSRWKRQ